ncbi:MAG TPA: sensor histidine kinase [Ktedonobacteraceae bacterium]
MLTSPDIRLFSAEPAEAQSTRKRGLCSNVRVLGRPPKTLLRETLIVIDVVSLIYAFLIVSTLYGQRSPIATIIVVEALFLASLIMLLVARTSLHFTTVLACYAAILVVCVLLNMLFQGNWGNFGLLALCGYSCYRLPLRWAWPVVVASGIALAETNGLNTFFQAQHLNVSSSLVTSLLIAAFLCWTGWTRRSRDMLVLELQEVQEQLRREMAHTEQLAATRERTRIARDMHDVLAHSLTMLSVQVQAARQLLHQHPERLVAKLDDIAALLRESIAESRRVVGLLRETAPSSTANGDLSTRLLGVIDRFGERTGVRCVFEEQGTPRQVSDKQAETLQYALQEALTNAHRHGAAQNVRAELRWDDAQVSLQVRDDGQGTAATEQRGEESSGHHGLQGMRERATALGGELSTASQTDGGFQVVLTLPFDKNSPRLFPSGGRT